MPNPFTDESRDSRFKVDVPGLMDTLRSPESLRRIVMEFKPASVSTGDFALKSMLDCCIDALKVRGDYRGIQRTLDTLFGPLGTERHPSIQERHAQVPNGTVRAGRH